MSDQENTLYYIVITSFVMPILMAALLVWFFVKFQKKKNQHELDVKDAKIAKQQLELDKQQALESERTRIAAEMHDDLGGGLTSIRFLSQKILRNLKNEENKSSVERIVSHAQTLVGNMSEIIWAMNAGYDTLDNLIAYTRRFAFEYLEPYEIELEFQTEGTTEAYKLSGEKRRNLFLVIKEALHNIVKHADAKNVSLKFQVNDQLVIWINDDGKGMDDNRASSLGNGLKNMNSRMESLGGKFNISNQNGIVIQLILDLS